MLIFMHSARHQEKLCVGLCENQVTLVSFNQICVLVHVLFF